MSIYPADHAWDDATDIVVVGAGGCGLTAAIAAARAGAQITVLEKLPFIRGNTGRSGGMIPAAGSYLQKLSGIEESAEDFAADIFAKNRNGSDPDTTLRLCRLSKVLVEWLVDEVGIKLVFIDDFKYPGHSRCRMHAPPSRTGSALIEDLKQAAERERAVTLQTATAALGLVVENGAVLGVVTEHDGRQRRLRATKVILASNGFAANPELVARYCPAVAGARYFGAEGNTGEGILWAQQLGAQLEFMDAYQSHASVATPDNVLITYSLITEGGIQINELGKRFGNETSGYSEHALAVLQQPGGEVWNLYDESLHRLGLKFTDYAAVYRKGSVYKAETLKELAASIRVDATSLAATLSAYHACAAGAADPFGRRDCRRLESPFFAVKVTAALFHTQGGLKVDSDARVLHRSGAPIANLYAGGGAAAGISGHGNGGYLSGNGLLTALGYGLIAGRHAATSSSEEVTMP